MPDDVSKNYKRHRIRDPKEFDKRSFRTIDLPKGKKMVVGCPKGHWDAKKQECKVGTKAQTLLTPRKGAKLGSSLGHGSPNPIQKRLAEFHKGKERKHDSLSEKYDAEGIADLSDHHFKLARLHESAAEHYSRGDTKAAERIEGKIHAEKKAGLRL